MGEWEGGTGGCVFCVHVCERVGSSNPNQHAPEVAQGDLQAAQHLAPGQVVGHDALLPLLWCGRGVVVWLGGWRRVCVCECVSGTGR